MSLRFFMEPPSSSSSSTPAAPSSSDAIGIDERSHTPPVFFVPADDDAGEAGIELPSLPRPSPEPAPATSSERPSVVVDDDAAGAETPLPRDSVVYDIDWVVRELSEAVPLLREFHADAGNVQEAKDAAERPSARTRKLQNEHSLRPLPWTHFWCNALTMGLLIGDDSRVNCCLKCCCHCFPRYQRLSNSYVRWVEGPPGGTEGGYLCGSSGRGGDHDFLKETMRATVLAWVVLFVVFLLTPIVIPIPYIQAVPTPAVLPWTRMLYVVLTVQSIILLYLLYLQSRSPSLVGGRKGDFPVLLDVLFRAEAPQFMISYAWGSKYRGLARSLGEVLPDAWVDATSLLTGHFLSVETMNAVSHARVLILLLTPEAINSRNCVAELYAALLNRSQRGTGARYRTIALVDESLTTRLSSSSAVIVQNSPRSVKANPSAFATFPVQTPDPGSPPQVLPPSPQGWSTIVRVLDAMKVIVVRSVPALIEEVEQRGNRYKDERDIARTYHWYLAYGKHLRTEEKMGRGGPKSYPRIPFNFGGTQKGLGCSLGCCRRRCCCCCYGTPPPVDDQALHNQSAFSWCVAACCYCPRTPRVTFGVGQQSITVDGSAGPMPHSAFTPQQKVIALMLLGVISSTLCFMFSVNAVTTGFTPSEYARAIVRAVGEMGAGVITAGVALIALWMPFCIDGNELLAPPSFLHSSILFPFLATRAMFFMRDFSSKFRNRTGARLSVVQVLQAGNATPLELGHQLEHDGEMSLTSVGSPGGSAGFSSRESSLQQLSPSSIAVSAQFPSILSLPGSVSSKSDGSVASVLPSRGPTKSVRLPLSNQHIRVVFALDQVDPIPVTSQAAERACVNNIIDFLHQGSDGFQQQTSIERISDVLSSKPRPLTVYVLFIDSPESQRALIQAMPTRVDMAAEQRLADQIAASPLGQQIMMSTPVSRNPLQSATLTEPDWTPNRIVLAIRESDFKIAKTGIKSYVFFVYDVGKDDAIDYPLPVAPASVCCCRPSRMFSSQINEGIVPAILEAIGQKIAHVFLADSKFLADGGATGIPTVRHSHPSLAFSSIPGSSKAPQSFNTAPASPQAWRNHNIPGSARAPPQTLSPGLVSDHRAEEEETGVISIKNPLNH